MNIIYSAKIIFDKIEKRYMVSFPDLDEAITEGESLEEALFNASEVLTLTLEGRLDEGMEIPKPSKNKGKNNYYSIVPSARVQAALLIKKAKGQHSIAELARALETSWPAAARLEDPHHWPTLRQLERAANATGKTLILSFDNSSSQSSLK